MHKSTLITLIICALLFSICTICIAQEDNNHADIKTVIAQGVGAGPDRAKARDEAIADAQRKAVEAGVGLYIKSETLVNNLTLVSDTIYKESAGFVQKYAIIDENYNPKTDLYWVKISADVSMLKIETALDNLYEKLKMAGNPRLLLLLNGTLTLPDPEGVKNALTAALVEKGFKVLDGAALSAARMKDAARLTYDGDIDAKTVMLLHDAADIVIVGKVSADEVERIAEDPVTFSQKVTLDAKIIRTDTAEILGAKRGLGTGAGFTEKSALETAEDKTGGDYLDKNIGTLLRAVFDPCKEFTVKVAGCSYEQMSAVESKIAAWRFTRGTDARFEEGYGVITANCDGNAKLLATHLLTATGIRLKVISRTGMTIMVKPIKI